MVDSLDYEREAIAVAGNQPVVDEISPRHKAIAVILDLMNPIGAGRRAIGR
jgi:hypothetical protein